MTSTYPYLSEIKVIVPFKLKGVIIISAPENLSDFIFIQCSFIYPQYDNHKMALALIEMLYLAGELNEPTYLKIMTSRRTLK